MKRLLTAVALALGLAAGCGDARVQPAGRPRAVTRPAPEGTATPAPRPRPARVERARCPRRGGNCAAVTGRVLYVEAVDPDGDGDAHYVLLGGDVTAPGLSVVDVEASMRPRRLPGRGELVSAAGPVYVGSHGQHQIQAVELHHQRSG